MGKLNITYKQAEILSLLLKFRFLTRKQIQIMLDHKYPSRIFSWLDELKENDYINYLYQKNFNNLPAIYSLGKNGTKYLRKEKELGKKADKIRKEKHYSQKFRDRCIFIADIYLSLSKIQGAKIHFYTKADLCEMEHLISPKPDAYFAIENKKEIKRYFLEIFNDTLRTNILRQRVKQYLSYFESEEWQDNTNKTFPEIILICPNIKTKNHLYFYIRQKINEDDHPNFYLSTREKIELAGLTRNSLEKILPKE